MNIKQIAQQYIDAGWQVVPLLKGEKRASTKWRTDTCTPAHFNDDDNIALKCGEPSNWLVDVDLDCAEAIAAAKELLPNTPLVHGRPSKPSSHHWFVCRDIKTSQFRDVKGANSEAAMIAEIRSTGGYTAAPPSLHPSGDVLTWESQGPPMPIEPDALYDSVRDIAITALIARHWSDFGHDDTGPLAGFLYRGGVLDTVRIIKLAATIAGAPSDTVRDATKFAESTVAKVRKGEKVTGGPTLEEHLGEAIVNRLRGWLKLADVDALDAMNAKHFFVRMGAKSVIGREDDPDGVVFQRPNELISEYDNQTVQTGITEDGKPTIEPLFKTWMRSPQRRSYNRIVFAPPPRHADPRDYNLWTDFAIEPAPGDCSLFLAHMRDVICSGNDEYYRYLLKWCAFAVQQPGLPPEVAVVLRGKLGTGKGTFVEAFERIFGARHYAHLDRSDELVRWNSLVSGKVIVFADEAFFAGDKENIGALKRIITEKTVRVSRKHIDSVEEANCIHLILATNEEWAIPAGQDERRFFAVNVSKAQMQRPEYFEPLRVEMENGGIAAFLDLMLRTPVTASEVRNRPKTDELRVQQNQSMDPHMKWWRECLHDELIHGIPDPAWGNWASVDALFRAYLHWCDTMHISRKLDKTELGRRMSELYSATPSQVRRINGEKERCAELRTLADARAQFDKEVGTVEVWDAPIASVLP